MLCEKCNNNEATIHYTEIINGVRNEHHLCGECAKDVDLGYYSGLFDGEFPFANLIKGILSAGGSDARGLAAANPYAQVICSKCGMTYEEFTKEGKFGCGECYNVFGPLIVDNIKKIQGSANHMGKHPGNCDVTEGFVKQMTGEARIRELKEQLGYAIRTEEYEEAARIRDEIRMIQERKETNA